MAADEAVRAKKCIGALRYLWRNSPSQSHHDCIQAMKDLLAPSPQQTVRGSVEDDALPLPPPVETSDGEGSSDEADGEGGEDEEMGCEMDGEGEVGGGNDSDGEDSLTAPTLQLGEQSDDDDHVKTPPLNVHGHLPDSQVRPDGWLGGFYHTWSMYYDKEDIEKKNADIPDSEKDGDVEINTAICKQVLLQEVKEELERLKLHEFLVFYILDGYLRSVFSQAKPKGWPVKKTGRTSKKNGPNT